MRILSEHEAFLPQPAPSDHGWRRVVIDRRQLPALLDDIGRLPVGPSLAMKEGKEAT